ncbi:MAG: type II secretion system secretin GspD [Desulfobacteraceae bacterium]|nr:type II secretion system secretin GspD [Desulfobacteraceae bacterium]
MKSHSTKLKCIISFFVIICFILTTDTVLAQKKPKKKKDDRFVSIDFNDVDIHLFVKFISDLTKKNFIIDDRVKGKVTIISPAKISVNEAYKVFESVLEVHGYTTVESGKVTKIVASPQAKQKSIETLMKGDIRSPEDKIVTQIVPLRYADTNDVKRLFAPLISKSSAILSYQPTNTLIITDMYSNIRRLLKILKVIDVTGVGQELSIIPLENADATKLVRVMTTVFQQKRSKKKSPISSGDAPKFVADERTNTIVVMASEDDTLKIRALIKKLDMETPKGKEKIRVYYLEHATAEELAKVLQSLSTKRTSRSTKKGKKTSPIVSEGVNITADKATNSLIIMADKDDYMVLEDVIKKLDIPRAMVYIECLIMEVNVERGFSLGSEWMMGVETDFGSKEGFVGGGSSGNNDTPYNTLSGLRGGGFPSGFSLGVAGEAMTIGGIPFPSIGAIIQAYKKDEDVHILSTPQLLAMDNEEASIVVGQNVPYQTREGASTSTSDSNYNTFEYKDVAIQLTITPQISKDRLIRLKISQEVSRLKEPTAETGTGERPTTLKRTIDTTVIVNDNNTIVIGGLIDDSFTDKEYKIPCLGDITGLGWLFKNVSKARDKTNLYIFLTPHVIENAEEAKAHYIEKKNEIDTAEERMKEETIKMYERTTTPKLEELKYEETTD